MSSEATTSGPKTAASAADKRTDADPTVNQTESATSSSGSEYLEFQNSDAENPLPALGPSHPADDERCVCVVLCPPDGGPWARFTCALAFIAALVCDGVCLSLFLLDSRVGMSEYVPRRTHTLEHVAAVGMFRYAAEPFVCAFINSYGFRYSLFFGGIASVTWMVLYLLFFENQFLLKYYWCLAIIGGIGAGMIKTSFFILISTLFVVKRQTAHSMVHLGSFTGMLLIPPFTEYVILTMDWKSALYFHLSLTSLTLVFWLLVATPVPLKIQGIENELFTDTMSFFQSRATVVSRTIAGNLPCKKSQTIWHMIGNRELRMVPFIRKVPVGDNNYRIQFLNPVDLKVNYWLFGNKQNRKVCCRNVTNMFRNRMIGSRPMYRDDIYFDGNIALLTTIMKHNLYSEYLMQMTHNLTVRDLNEEKHQRFNVLPTAMIRVLNSMFKMSIWCNGKFCLLVVGEVLIHASCTIPFIFIKGPPELKSSAEAMIILIAGCLGLLFGRGIGHLLHKSSLDVVPPYHVCVVLIANGLSLFLCTSDDIGKTLPFFAIFGCLFGYYRSVQNTVLFYTFPLNKFNNICGQISIIRGIALFIGVLTAIKIQKNEPTASNESVYVFAGLLMMAGGVCVGLLQRVNTTARGTRQTRYESYRGYGYGSRSPPGFQSRCVV